MFSEEIRAEAIRRASELPLADVAIDAIKRGQCYWQTEDGDLVNIDTDMDPKYDAIRSERDKLAEYGMLVYYAFSGVICHGLQTNNYLGVSSEVEDWQYDGIKPCNFDSLPNLKIVNLAVSSGMTYGSFDFGDSYVNCDNGLLTRVSLSEVLTASKSSIF